MSTTRNAGRDPGRQRIELVDLENVCRHQRELIDWVLALCGRYRDEVRKLRAENEYLRAEFCVPSPPTGAADELLNSIPEDGDTDDDNT